MRIERIDRALEECENHVLAVEQGNAELVDLLTQSILVLMCAEFEKTIRALVLERCGAIDDNGVINYVQNSVDRSVRGVAVSEMAGLLGMFGKGYREEFSSKTRQNDRVVRMYMSIVANRNNVAHGKDSTATFRDVKQYYESGHIVLDYFRDSLFRSFDQT